MGIILLFVLTPILVLLVLFLLIQVITYITKTKIAIQFKFLITLVIYLLIGVFVYWDKEILYNVQEGMGIWRIILWPVGGISI